MSSTKKRKSSSSGKNALPIPPQPVHAEVDRLKRILVYSEDQQDHEESPLATMLEETRSKQKEIIFPKSPYEYDRSLEPVQTSRGFTSFVHSLVQSDRPSDPDETISQNAAESESFIRLPSLDDQEEKQDEEEKPKSLRTTLEETRFKGNWHVADVTVKSGLIHLHNEIVAYIDHVSPSASDMRQRFEIVERVRTLASGMWPQSSVKVFGSCATGLCLPDSDVDITLLNAPSNAIHRLHSALKAGGNVDMLQKLDHANVPIIKFKFGDTPFTVDVCFNEVGGLSTATFMKRMMESMPELKPLVLVVKHFLTQRDLNETYRGGMGSYLCFLSVVVACQRARRMHPERPLNLAELLLDYLDLYGNLFNYEDVGVSLLDGGRFFQKSEKKWLSGGDRKRGVDISFWLQDPMNSTSNVGAKAYKMTLVRHAFSVAHSALISKIKAHEVSSSSSQRPQSILATIIRVKPEELVLSSGQVTTFSSDSEEEDF